jgi:hypothetical protein
MKIINQCFLLSKDSELNADLRGGMGVIKKGDEPIIRGKKAVMHSAIISSI